MASDGRSLAAIEYLQESLDDAAVRKNLARGAEALRRASGQLTGRNRVAKVTRRARLQTQLREAVTSFGRAGAAAREAELKRERSRRRRRRLLLVLGAAGAGAALHPTAREKASTLAASRRGAGQPEPAPAPAMPQPTKAE